MKFETVDYNGDWTNFTINIPESDKEWIQKFNSNCPVKSEQKMTKTRSQKDQATAEGSTENERSAEANDSGTVARSSTAEGSGTGGVVIPHKAVRVTRGIVDINGRMTDGVAYAKGSGTFDFVVAIDHQALKMILTELRWSILAPLITFLVAFAMMSVVILRLAGKW